jgi:hypothetical protein
VKTAIDASNFEFAYANGKQIDLVVKVSEVKENMVVVSCLGEADLGALVGKDVLLSVSVHFLCPEIRKYIDQFSGGDTSRSTGWSHGLHIPSQISKTDAARLSNGDKLRITGKVNRCFVYRHGDFKIFTSVSLELDDVKVVSVP